MTIPWYVADEMEKRGIEVTQPVYKKQSTPKTPSSKQPKVPTYNVQDIQTTGPLFKSSFFDSLSNLDQSLRDAFAWQQYTPLAPLWDQNAPGMGGLFDALNQPTPPGQFGGDYFSQGTSQGFVPQDPYQSNAIYPTEVVYSAQLNEASMFGAHDLESGGRGLPGGYDYEGAFDSFGNLINVDLLPNMMSPLVAEAQGIPEDWRNYMYGGPEDNYALRAPDELDDGGAPSYGGYQTAGQWGYPSSGGWVNSGGNSFAYPWGLTMWRIT